MANASSQPVSFNLALARSTRLSMHELLQIATKPASPNYCNSGEDYRGEGFQNVAMAKKPKRFIHYLREWREYREMTQDQLATAMKPSTNASVISLLETGGRGLSNKWLERLAVALRTKKGFILDVNPFDTANSVLEIWNEIPENDKQRALGYLEALKRRAG